MPNIAVNIDVKMPIDKVIANPLTGPVPIAYKTIAAIKVVILASKIVVKALEKPSLIASCGDVPVPSSYLILENIKTLASTAIPTVKTIPAIPGNVSVAPINDINPVIKIRFDINARFAAKPNHR